MTTTPPDATGSSGTRCPLCSSTRREYLFVMRNSRMTRCHECGLIFRSETGPAASGAVPSSYLLESDVESRLRQELSSATPSTRVLQVVSSGDPVGRLGSDPRLTVETLAFPGDEIPLEKMKGGTFDSVFINGVLEQVPQPVQFLSHLRRVLKAGGSLSMVVDGSPFSRLPEDESGLPRHMFSPSTLIRVLESAGFTCEVCGLLQKRFGAHALDSRLEEDARFPVGHRAMAALREPTQVASGLLHARARAAPPPKRLTLSIIMPVFNEAATFQETFDRVYNVKLERVDKELVLVESNSTDGSRELVRAIEHLPGVRVIYEESPRGKGHAVRAGFAAARGDILLIQDADSEYDVADYDIVLEPILELSTTFVLGSRHLGGRTWKIRQFEGSEALAITMNLAHQGFTALANYLYGTEMRDPTTMYKVFRRECIQGLVFHRNRFDFDWELVCKLIRRGHIPVEVPINYRSRSYAEGKKVRFFGDPMTWLRTIVASRFESLDR